MTDGAPVPIAGDLAPGDRRAGAFDWSELTLRRITGPHDPDFAPAFARLWAEFGPRGEMERREVIEARLGWDPAQPVGNTALLYEMLVVRRGAELVAMRDHTAVVHVGAGGSAPTVVHLSHVLVEPAHRGSGLAGWLRALPLQAARRCAVAARRGPGHPVVLVAEMEHPEDAEPATMLRLGAYERAGFRKVDPAAAAYEQPDFRPAEQIAGGPPRPVPLALIVRRVGREAEDTIDARELGAVVGALYAVYGAHIAPEVMAPVVRAARRWLDARPDFRLLPPTA